MNTKIWTNSNNVSKPLSRGILLILFLSINGGVFASNKRDVFILTIDSLSKNPKVNFKREFPFEVVLGNGVIDIQVLEKYRSYIEKKMSLKKSNRFVTAAFSYYRNTIKYDGADLKKLKHNIVLAEQLLASKHFIPKEISGYRRAGMSLLSVSADSLESWIETGALSKSDDQTMILYERLKDNNFIINTPISNYEKLLLYAREGRWSYIARKLTGTYKKQFYFACTIFLLGVLTVFVLVRTLKRRKRQT